MNSPIEVDFDLSRNVCDSNQYIEYYPGDLNVILSVPHGGRVRPDTIPDRDAGSYVKGRVVFDHAHQDKDLEKLRVRRISDMNTIQLSILVAKELHAMTARLPHVVVNQLYRGKMDANCDREKATFNVPEAVSAWECYHQCIERAKSAMRGRGLFLDMHGQSHSEGWIELGYALSAETLDQEELDMSLTSIANLAQVKNYRGHDLISGASSLGAMLSEEGYTVVPSPNHPRPQGGNYYTGGYNTIRHGSLNGGLIDGIQIECPVTVRQNDRLKDFSKSLATAIVRFWKLHYSEH